MRSRVATETLPCPLITRDTVAVDTCASRASSLRVTPIPSPGPLASGPGEGMGVTLKDVAREAQVSTATVSRVINGHGNVSVATRERILGVAERLRYVPDSGARSEER